MTESRQIKRTARQVLADMARLRADMMRVGGSAGKLMALLDNEDQPETLATERSEAVYALVGNLSRSYDDLAKYLASTAQARLEQSESDTL